MEQCDACGARCDKDIGMYRELKTVYIGGKRDKSIEYSPKMVSFFCSEDCRNDFLSFGLPGGARTLRKKDEFEFESH